MSVGNSIKGRMSRIGKTPVSWDILISLFEFFITGIIGLVFYFPLTDFRII